MEEQFPEPSLPEHVYQLHAGKSENQLRKRLDDEGLVQASSFLDDDVAHHAIEDALSANAFEIHEWVSQPPRRRLTLDHNAAFDVGIVVRAGMSGRRTRRSRLVLEPAATREGYRIVTAFPA